MLDPETVEESDREKLVSETKWPRSKPMALSSTKTTGASVRWLSKSTARVKPITAGSVSTPSANCWGTLDHSLKIADGVMRFRVFKVDPEAPVLPAPPATAVIMAPTGDDDERRGRGGRYRDE